MTLRPRSHPLRALPYITMIATLALLPFVLPSTAAAQAPPSHVVVDAVQLEVVQDQRLVTGEIRALRRSRVAAEEPGIVTALAIREGDVVKKDDLLARLESSRLELELAQLAASKRVADAVVNEWLTEVERTARDLESLRELDRKSATNPKELADAESAWKLASARHLGAAQELEVIAARRALLEKRVADTRITAPFDGVVIATHKELGEWVSQGEAVVELVSTGAVEAWLAVPQSFYAAAGNPGVSIPIRVEASGRQLVSKAIRRIPIVDSNARNFALVVTLPNSEGDLTHGMSLAAWVPTGRSGEQLTVAKDAVLRNEVGPYIYVARKVAPDGPAMATPVTIEILFTVGDRVAVRSPALRPEDPAIREGNERLFPMAPVIPLPAAAKKVPQ